MAEIDDLRRENSKLKQFEKEIELYKKDATYRGYYILNKVANQQIDILEEFNVSEEIRKNPKDDKFFDRAKALWEGLPDMISGLNKLKVELKITGSKDKDLQDVPFIETVAETRK